MNSTLLTNCSKSVSLAASLGAQRPRYFSTSQKVMNSLSRDGNALTAKIEQLIAELECKLIPLLIGIYDKQLKTESSLQVPSPEVFNTRKCVSNILMKKKGGGYRHPTESFSGGLEDEAKVSRIKDELIVEGCKAYVLLNTYLIAMEVSRRFKNSFTINVSNISNDSINLRSLELEIQGLISDPKVTKPMLSKLTDLLNQIKNASQKLEESINIDIQSYEYIPYNRNLSTPTSFINQEKVNDNELWVDILAHAGKLMNSKIYQV